MSKSPSEVAKQGFANLAANRIVYQTLTVDADELEHSHIDSQLIGAMMALLGPTEFADICRRVAKQKEQKG